MTKGLAYARAGEQRQEPEAEATYEHVWFGEESFRVGLSRFVDEVRVRVGGHRWGSVPEVRWEHVGDTVFDGVVFATGAAFEAAFDDLIAVFASDSEFKGGLTEGADEDVHEVAAHRAMVAEGV